MSASKRPPKEPTPLSTKMDWRIGLYFLAGINLGLLLIVGLIAEGPIQMLAAVPPPWRVVLGVAVLLVSFDIRSWLRLRRLARAHPHEPWIWDRAWRRELPAETLWRVLKQVAPWLIGLGILSILLIAGPVQFVLSDRPWVFLAVAGVILVFNGLMLWSVHEERLQPVLSWLHFGRPRLRVPRVPLKLGTRYPLHLIIPASAQSDFARVTGFKAELRRMRHRSESSGHGKDRRTVTISTTEYTQEQALDASGLSDGKELVIELELPAAGARNTSVLHGSDRCLWELHLTGEAPGRKLELCYLLPAYHLTGENPSAWKDVA